jgi:hypothetical protein
VEESGEALAVAEASAAKEANTCTELSALLAVSEARTSEAIAQEVAACEEKLAHQMEQCKSELHAASERISAMDELTKAESAEIDNARKASANADNELKLARHTCEELLSESKPNSAVEHNLRIQEAKLIVNQACCTGLVLSIRSN